ncbi:uncharacterized protein LOC132747903 [Ruditapes philippinarum]|uniref:uncharacterized protein LOC132747903 n=1 Tax=Ruditapes philippinarum TaxID=129788 RepID=UPI00295BEFBD|nr:uncharacterized protein LOC132747903 [Ruditapes philippinarum]
MAENDNLMTEIDQSLICLERAITDSEISNGDTLILNREDGSKILHCIEKSKRILQEEQPSGTKKNALHEMTSYQGKKKTVYIYIDGTEKNLEKIIKVEFSKLLSKMLITCVSLKGNVHLKGEYPLIVLCPTNSRLLSDIEFVLEQLKQFSLPGRFALAVINMTRVNDLPRLPIESRLDTGVYSNIHFIDMAFTMEHLMYDCSMNREATKKIQSFVNSMYQQERPEIPTCYSCWNPFR